VHGVTAEKPPVTIKSRSRSNSPDHNRSVSICNIPNVSPENDAECDPYHIKCIEQILNDADTKDVMNNSFTKNPEVTLNPTHFKAYSEDLGVKEKLPISGNGINIGNLKSGEKGNPKSIWMSSPSTFPLFFYQPSKSPDKMEVVAEQLNENLRIEDEPSSSPNI